MWINQQMLMFRDSSAQKQNLMGALVFRSVSDGVGHLCLGKGTKAFNHHDQLGERGNCPPFKKAGMFKIVPTI